MYDELIKRLLECVSGECWNCSQHKDSYDGQRTCADNLMKQAADAIEELSKPRWIPVTERLPEDKERVLIFYWLSTKPKTPWYKVATFSKKLSDVDEYDLYGKDHPGFYGSDSEYGYYEHTDVEYWMPLPPPPKEVEP